MRTNIKQDNNKRKLALMVLGALGLIYFFIKNFLRPTYSILPLRLQASYGAEHDFNDAIMKGDLPQVKYMVANAHLNWGIRPNYQKTAPCSPAGIAAASYGMCLAKGKVGCEDLYIPMIRFLAEQGSLVYANHVGCSAIHALAKTNTAASANTLKYVLTELLPCMEYKASPTLGEITHYFILKNLDMNKLNLLDLSKRSGAPLITEMLEEILKSNPDSDRRLRLAGYDKEYTPDFYDVKSQCRPKI